MSATCPIGHSNLFTLSGVDAQGVIMNRRYTMIESVRIRATGDGEPVEFDVPCSLMPDARDNISGETARIVFTGPKGSADETIASSVQLSVNFNYNTGGITNQATITVNPEATMTYEYVSCKGRVMVSVQNEMQDITIDPTEDFLIALTTEEIQDYRSIFKIDLARTLSEAIKRQVRP